MPPACTPGPTPPRPCSADTATGGLALDPTSGSTLQQRAHLSPEAGVTLDGGSSVSGTIRTEETIAISAHAASSSNVSWSAFSGSSTAACSEEPMTLALRASSIGTVMRRRMARMVSHFAASASSRQSCRRRREQFQMHAGVVAEAGAPGFLGGEAQHRGEPGAQTAVQMVQHGARGAAAQAVRAVAVERVLADVEVERRQVDRAEIVQVGIDAGPVVGLDRGAESSRRVRSGGAAPSVPVPAFPRPARVRLR